jgi:hypothetical protein
MHRSGLVWLTNGTSDCLEFLSESLRYSPLINRLMVEALRVSPDDIFVALIPVPNENFSFGRGELQLAEGAPRW